MQNPRMDEPFTLPLPPPPDIFYVRGGPGEGREGREHEDIMLRKVPNDVARRFRAAAGGRALTHAQYLAALVDLHESLRRRADDGDETARAELERLGLQSVTV
jgi:hypothetical protein